MSTQEQSLELQIDALTKAGCEKIFQDKTSGARCDRPGLQLMLEVLREGDELIVWKLDRLGRTAKSLMDMAKGFEERKIAFKSLMDNIDTSTSSGMFFFHVMASLAQLERDLTIERTKAGLAVARAAGKLMGRKRVMTDKKIEMAKKLLQGGSRPVDVAKSLGVSIPTLYRWIPSQSLERPVFENEINVVQEK